METLSAEQARAIDDAIARWKDRAGALLPMLHAIQDRLGYIPGPAVVRVAHALNLSRAEVHGVVSFYHHFRTEPAGRHTVQLCRAEACQSMGAEKLAGQVQERLGIGFHETTTDGQVTLEPVYCLGNCACAPSAMIDGQLHGRLNEQGLVALLGELRGAP
jgi:formate dehydrogenase subunit gamma